jgi:uncharacterized protein (TIGR01777 family)
VNILLSGASGLVGTACAAELRAAGHSVLPLNRSMEGEGLPWDVSTGRVNLRGTAPEALIHLAGENIAGGRWTEERMKKIRSSRVDATRELCEFLATTEHPPQVMLSASAIGIYGPRGDKVVTEQTPNATDFLGELCYEWEKATIALERVGCRVVHMRFGIILSPEGGALKKMLPVFKFALGGPMGEGRHWMSWISLEDVVRTIAFLLDHAAAHGPVNVVTPNPVLNSDFAETLGRVVKRPAIFRTPAGVLRMVYGEFVDAALLSSQRVEPQRLKELGFEWKRPEIEDALVSML